MGWTNQDKFIHLTNSLTGTAEMVIDGAVEMTFEQLVEKLRRRFGSEEQYDRFRSLLKLRKRKDGETLQELALDIETMARLAYPNMGAMDHPMNDILLREAFVDALDNPGFERKIREHQPKTFDNALTLALRLEALYKSQQAQKESSKPRYARTHRQKEVRTRMEKVVPITTVDQKRQETIIRDRTVQSDSKTSKLKIC